MSIQPFFKSLEIEYENKPDLSLIDLGSVLITHTSGRNYLVDINQSQVLDNNAISCSFDACSDVQADFAEHSNFDLTLDDLNPDELTVSYFLGDGFELPTRAALYIHTDDSTIVIKAHYEQYELVASSLIEKIHEATYATIDNIIHRITGYDAEQLDDKSEEVCIYLENDEHLEQSLFTFSELISLFNANRINFQKLVNC